MKARLLPFFFLLCVAPLPGAEAYQPPSVAAAGTQVLTAESAAKAVALMSSPNAAVRAKAATALRQRSLNAATKEQAKVLFQQARAAHEKVLQTLVKRGVPVLGQVKSLSEAWATKRTQVMALILTDYHKEGDKVAMLTREHAETEKLRLTFEKELAGVAAAWKPLADATLPLAQLDRELELLDDPNARLSGNVPETYLKRLGAAEELIKALGVVFEYQQMTALQATVAKHNESCKWAPKSAVAFAAILNAKRATMNLAPLRLDEALSQAATGHSKEMLAMSYFAHESPVAANKTPGDRARNANFSGGWSGENIFMGSAGANEAYQAWWGSDGHRFIMFANGPNTLGLGPVGVHWTLMTGSKTWES